MFEDLNKSKIEFEKYIELKKKIIVKSYTERFKWVDKFLYYFSWFGNAVSVFLAYFFMQKLFFSSFNQVGKSIIITFGIILFLAMFELLKRYVFGMFSIEVIKEKKQALKTNMISFFIGTLALVSGSFYLSLHGAKEFIDNSKGFEIFTENKITNKVDSLNNFYFNEYIKPLKETNKTLTEQNSKYSEEQTYKTRYAGLISENNKKIDKNNDLIKDYEKRRDLETDKYKDTETIKLTENLSENKSNTISFIILSTLIELIIMIGVFYDKFYDFKLITEYEETVINTPEFRKWHRNNFMLELIYGKAKNMGDPIPPVNSILELSETAGMKITKSELDKFIKILYYLEIVKLEGNRRVTNLKEEDGKKALRDYYGIN
jgi:hypothetical protein